MVYGYARVSTKAQAAEGNGLEVQDVALRKAGAEIIYRDAYTGTVSDRPALNELLAVIGPGDVLTVTKLDRIARSAAQGFTLIQDLINRGVAVHVLNMGLIDQTPTGRLILHIMLAFSEFERDMIVERTREGKDAARRAGKLVDGRPPKFSRKQMNLALDLLQSHSYKQVSEMTGISKSTLIRAKRAGVKI